MISEYLVVSLATLAAIGIVAAAMLKGWQGWLEVPDSLLQHILSV